jgi:hypothetical protein
LPRAGGLFDQDYYHVILIRAYQHGIAKKRKYDEDKAAREAKSKAGRGRRRR